MTATAQYPQNITFTQFRDAIRAQFAVLQTLGELYTVDLPKRASLLMQPQLTTLPS